MVTILQILAKKKNSSLYCAIYKAGNGGAWDDLYELYKKAQSEEEAIEWASNIVISNKWGLQPKWYKELSILGDATLKPCLAGQDELIVRDNCYAIDNGFQLNFSCSQQGDGCFVEFNEGSRKNSVWRTEFIKLKPVASISCQHRAGRSGRETLHIQKLIDGWEIVAINKGFYASKTIKEREMDCFIFPRKDIK